MSNPSCRVLVAGGLVFLYTFAPPGLAGAGSPSAPGLAGQGSDGALAARAAATSRFLAAQPGAAVSERGGRPARVYGRAFSHGVTALWSAEAFRLAHSGMFGVPPQDLVPAQGGAGIPLMQRPDGSPKFTAFTYGQERGGVPVFGAKLVLLVRNEADHPLVLASSALRDLGGFRVDAPAAARPMSAAAGAAVRARAAQLALLEGDPRIVSTQRVIWAVPGDRSDSPRLADASEVTVGLDRWLLVSDAATAEVLHEEHLICIVDIVGNASGRATEGAGSDVCEPEAVDPLPYLEVVAGVNSDFADADGDFVIPNPGTSPITVSALLSGQWFDVFNAQGAETSESVMVTPPGPANLLFNSPNTDATVRAQVNGYVHSNRVRDFTIQANPSYPTLGNGGFPVNVNRTDGFCPGNAWYDSGGPSINFCLAGGGAVNTAYSSVVYHEYGHHLVNAGGSGQGAYGEGMGDVMSVLILDNPIIGLGFSGNCFSGIRSADNTMQYPCSGEIHFCGQLIAGCIWDIRNELVTTEPDDYTAVLGALAINSIILHDGSSIEPDIAIDYLTLDDDDADLCNGTPHYAEIATGFAAHNMFAEDLTFVFPSGLPELVAPGGGTTVDVELSCLSAAPEPGTGVLHVDNGGGFVAIPMDEGAPNSYEAVFPASACGTSVSFYFSAETQSGEVVTEPEGAPAASFTALSAGSIADVFADDFESNLGWTVTNSGGLADGAWERGTPAGAGDRGDPTVDGDGSGQCYLTDNVAGNSDVDNGSTTLTSPVLDASGAGGDVYVSYWRWFSNTQGNAPFQDVLVVDVSSNGGGSWVNLESVGPSGPEVDGGWFRKTFRVADFVAPTSQFRIRFVASDTDPQSVVEAAVDGVELSEIQCAAPCPADCGDGDGAVTVVDLLDLLAQWGGPGACDLDGGGIGISDLLALLADWGPCR